MLAAAAVAAAAPFAWTAGATARLHGVLLLNRGGAVPVLSRTDSFAIDAV